MQPLKEFLLSNTRAVLLKTNFQVDLAALQDYYHEQVTKHTKVYQGTKRHGGWSIQSNTGSIGDGWQTGGTTGLTLEQIKQQFPDGYRFQKPTALYTGAAQTLIEQLNRRGFNAKRTRIADLEPNSDCAWHQDSKYDQKRYGFWRGHIAIQTNPQAEFMFRSQDHSQVQRYAIPADGYLYLADIQQEHRIENTSDQHRIHILTDTNRPIEQFDILVEPVVWLD